MKNKQNSQRHNNYRSSEIQKKKGKNKIENNMFRNPVHIQGDKSESQIELYCILKKYYEILG